MYFDQDRFPGLVMVEQVGSYSYDWESFTIFKEPATRLYYWIAESGCSCTGPLEDSSKADLDRGNIAAMRAAFKSWLESDPEIEPGEKVEYLEKLHQIR